MLSREKIQACWLGKAVGGTLGQTFEGLEGPLDADFYFPVPTEMVANDDLDLQVLFAVVMDQLDVVRVDRNILAGAWASHVKFPWNEYGVAMRNLAEGILPPATGSFDNWFSCGEGAAIRSELWACLAPGNPDLAQAYAYEDACFDHAGDGIHAAQFLARLQSMAFIESDSDVLLDTALAGIPSDSELYAAVTDTRKWVNETDDWRQVREWIVAKYGRQDFTDVRPNTAFVVLGWLMGTDFSERICITNNCGEDTDSSTASLGALLGILDPSCIDAKWLAPIGNDLVLNPEITGIIPPATLDGFTDLVMSLAERLGSAWPSAEESPFDPSEHTIPVHIGWANTRHGRWDIRDQSELPPIGSPLIEGVVYEEAELPGTWMKMHRDKFADRILLVKYQFSAGSRKRVRLMINSSTDCRAWIDGQFVHGAQGSPLIMPAPHMAPVGQTVDLEVSPETHELVVALKRPPLTRPIAEWIIALVELPSALWVENAFRPRQTRELEITPFTATTM